MSKAGSGSFDGATVSLTLSAGFGLGITHSALNPRQPRAAHSDNACSRVHPALSASVLIVLITESVITARLAFLCLTKESQTSGDTPSGAVLVSANDNVLFRARLRRSNADITTSHYSIQGAYSDGYNYPVTSISTGGDQSSRIFSDVQTLQDTANIIRGMNLSNNTEWSANMNVYIFDPLGTNNNKAVMTDYFVRGNNTYNTLQVGKNGFFLSDNQNALSGISFYISSGNIIRGNFKLYGIK